MGNHFLGRIQAPRYCRICAEHGVNHDHDHNHEPKPRMGLLVLKEKKKTPRRKKPVKYHPFIYNNVKLIRVVDGDTVELEVNLGYHLKFRDKFRLVRIDAPETNRKATRVEGTKSKVALEQMLHEEIDEHSGVWIEAFKKDSFGRWLCEIYTHRNNESINERMLTEGHAIPYKR